MPLSQRDVFPSLCFFERPVLTVGKVVVWSWRQNQTITRVDLQCADYLVPGILSRLFRVDHRAELGRAHSVRWPLENLDACALIEPNDSIMIVAIWIGSAHATPFEEHCDMWDPEPEA